MLQMNPSLFCFKKDSYFGGYRNSMFRRKLYEAVTGWDYMLKTWPKTHLKSYRLFTCSLICMTFLHCLNSVN